MVWEALAIDKPHLVYIILGGFTTLFMLCSSVIKERLYIGEATVATICGIIFGPHAANLIDPGTWGNTDKITLEFSRIVLVVQCFAVGVELPKAYMERHWRSVVFLLVPVMTFGWLVTSLFIWALIPNVNWLDSLCIAACVTATDPVLASSVVGKGKFAKRVPKHLRDLLSAESGCNDGMAFPFIYLALYIIRYYGHPSEVAFHWFCYTILWECVWGATYGVIVGYIARRAVRYAHERDLIDRESFLVFYFVLALFCAGSGSLLGMDDLLIGFACGVGFSNDGWFTEKTEESHVSNVIDLLINLAFFVYFGTIIPWAQYNSGEILGLTAWRLVVLGILVILFRRIPIMLALKPLIPDIKTWREALFAGHFGPIDYNSLAVLPDPGFEHYNVIELIWPLTTFLVICSIVVHGSSIAVFTLGKHINTLTLTMSYTQANEEGPSWMDRLPRIQTRSKSMASSMRKQDTDTDMDEKSDYPRLPEGIAPGNFLRRQKEEDDPSRASSRRGMRRRQWDSGRGPGGPISQSAISPAPRDENVAEPQESRSDSDTLRVKSGESSPSQDQIEKETHPEHQVEKESQMKKQKQETPDKPGEREGEVYEEGQDTIYEDEEGNVLKVEHSKTLDERERQEHERQEYNKLFHEKDVHHGTAQKEDMEGDDPGHKAVRGAEKAGHEAKEDVEHPQKQWRKGMKRMSTFGGLRKREDEGEPNKPQKEKPKAEPKRGPARAYQFGNTIIVEDEDGEVLKKYDIPAPNKKEKEGGDYFTPNAWEPISWGQPGQATPAEAGPSDAPDNSRVEKKEGKKASRKAAQEADDAGLRFTITAGGRRMSKAEFIQQIQRMDPKARAKIVEESDAPEAVKEEARQDFRERTQDKRRAPDRTATSSTQDPHMIAEAQEQGVDDSEARLKRVSSHESTAGPDGLTLVDSNNRNIPFHDVSRDLHDSRTNQETAAERRRREARQRAQPSRSSLPPRQRHDVESDSEDDGTERVPPQPPQQGSQPAEEDEQGETAAERRRREGALGVSKEESSSDEDESQPRQVPRQPGIRFAEEPTRDQAESGGHKIRWGKTGEDRLHA
ncbi:Na+/H+ antiporter [Taxawa tesnikishii (nom. ined.)]|nr:Na+/H+ antiporter [Dothideales sp. JES 119]